ncbi:MAG: 16S rRNA (cytidine(1402)-2'-O)-methyltransferase [Bacteriovorax sp.]
MSSLTLVTLPIGNSKDITLRAIETIKAGKYFYAEDTRVFRKLLETLGIDSSMKVIDSFHDHSEGKIQMIVEKIQSGIDVFLVSDAGSPVISDPAYPLIKKMRDENIEVRTIPGVTSVITALELSGLPPHPFHFWGFISRSKNERKDFFRELESIQGTHIFFESPHRILETVGAFFEVLPHAELVITRELTKSFESIYRLNKDGLHDIQKIVVEKGEFVALFHVENLKSSPVKNGELVELVEEYLKGKGGTKKLAKIFSKILNSETKLIYDQLNQSGKD